MSKLHVFIDGSWLYKVVKGQVFDRFVESPDTFEIDFIKLNSLLLNHVRKYRVNCNEIGECHFVTSIFKLPPDFDAWVGKKIQLNQSSMIVQQSNINETRRNVKSREDFAHSALEAGYDPKDILRVGFQEWMLLCLIDKQLRYQEKQVDTTLVALLMKSVFQNKDDCFALVAGDADILPAISIAFPEYTKSIFPVLTSLDERNGRNKQTSYKYFDFNFEIDTLILQNNVHDIMKGNVHRCTECHKLFTTQNVQLDDKIKSGKMLPRCKQHR